MKNIILNKKQMKLVPATLAWTMLIVLLSFMMVPASAQIISQQKFIYLSGQLTSSNTGAPIPDHQIFIESDSLSNGGWSYHATTKTDVNGFYWDTIVTTTTDGLMKLYLYDFDGNKIELDRYYRFVWDNEYLMFADFAIFDPDANMELQANFMTQPDEIGGDPLKVIFLDESIGTSIKSWSWDFGDGVTSTVQDPEHRYANSGIFRVSLTITSLPPEFGEYQTSTITKQVQVGLREYHHIGGHVFAQQFPIDLGIAYLYGFDDDNKLELIDTALINTLGYYYFYEVPVGTYLTKSRLDGGSTLYGQFMPTYFRNAYDWNDAEQIEVEESDNWECDIWLRPSTGLESGNGNITGQIIYDTSLVNRTPIPAGDIDIILLDQSGHFLTCGLSTTEGYFDFNGLPYGTYQLFPDVAGISTSPMYVTLTEEEPEEEGVRLIIFPNEITFGIGDHPSEFIGKSLVVYPNPVKDQARISIEMKKTSAVEVRITDIAGRTVLRHTEQLLRGQDEVVFSTVDLPAGVYQITLIPEDQVVTSGKFLKSN